MKRIRAHNLSFVVALACFAPGLVLAKPADVPLPDRKPERPVLSAEQAPAAPDAATTTSETTPTAPEATPPNAEVTTAPDAAPATPEAAPATPEICLLYTSDAADEE